MKRRTRVFLREGFVEIETKKDIEVARQWLALYVYQDNDVPHLCKKHSLHNLE